MSNSQIIQYIAETYEFGWLRAALIDRIVNNMTYDDIIIKYCYSLDTVKKLRMFKDVEQDVQSAEHKDMGDIIRVLDPKAFDTSVGRWKIDDDKEVIICSKCHMWFNADDRFKYMRYCPNCGAKMFEPQESKEKEKLSWIGKRCNDCGNEKCKKLGTLPKGYDCALWQAESEDI